MPHLGALGPSTWRTYAKGSGWIRCCRLPSRSGGPIAVTLSCHLTPTVSRFVGWSFSENMRYCEEFRGMSKLISCSESCLQILCVAWDALSGVIRACHSAVVFRTAGQRQGRRPNKHVHFSVFWIGWAAFQLKRPPSMEAPAPASASAPSASSASAAGSSSSALGDGRSQNARR